MPPPNENNNPVTESAIITNREATQTNVTNKNSIISPQSQRTLHAKTKPTINSLFIYDYMLSKQAAEAILNAYYTGAKLISIKNWNNIISTLSKYSKIDTLIFYTHSIPGSLLIAGKSPTLNNQSKKLKSSKVVITNRIIFEGCSIMEDPLSVAELTSGIVGDRTKIFGYTLFAIIQPLKVRLTGNGDIQQIKDILSPHKIYLLPLKTSYEDLANTKKKVTFYKRWFRAEYNESPIPNSMPGDLPPRGIFSRSQLKNKTIFTHNEACIFKNKLRTPISHPYFVTMDNIKKIYAKQKQTPC